MSEFNFNLILLLKKGHGRLSCWREVHRSFQGLAFDGRVYGLFAVISAFKVAAKLNDDHGFQAIVL